MSQRSGFDQVMLERVINATTEAMGSMNQVHNRVSYLSSALPTVNRSRSGERLARIFTDWGTDFYSIRSALEHLNNKAAALHRHNIAVEQESNATPQEQ